MHDRVNKAMTATYLHFREFVYQKSLGWQPMLSDNGMPDIEGYVELEPENEVHKVYLKMFQRY